LQFSDIFGKNQTRRKVIKSAGVGIAAMSIPGVSAARKTTERAKEKLEKEFQKLVKKHGKPSIERMTVISDGETILFNEKHKQKVSSVKSEGYDTIQVETIQFNDGYSTTLISAISNQEVLVLFGRKRFRFVLTDEMVQTAKSSSQENLRKIEEKSSANTAVTTASSLPSLAKGEGLSIGTASGGNSRYLGTTNPVTAPAASKYNVGDNKVGSAVSARYASYNAGAYAKVYQDVKIEDSGTIEISFNGVLNGIITAVIADATLEFNGYIKEKGTDSKKRHEIIDMSKIAEARSINKQYSPSNPGPGGNSGSLFRNVEPGTYEIGIELKTIITAISVSAATINFYPNFSTFDFNNYCNYNYISVDF